MQVTGVPKRYGRAVRYFFREGSRSGKVQGERLIKQQKCFPLSRQDVNTNLVQAIDMEQTKRLLVRLEANNKFLYPSLTVPSR